jgi:hypothetical protein
MMPAVAQDGVLAPVGIRNQRQPRGKDARIDHVAFIARSRLGLDQDRAGIEIDMPDQPRLGSGDCGIFRESEAPRTARLASCSHPYRT